MMHYDVLPQLRPALLDLPRDTDTHPSSSTEASQAEAIPEAEVLSPNYVNQRSIALPQAGCADPLVGRQRLLASLLARLTGMRPVQLNLVGAPGIGKTALASEIARDPQIQAHFSGGILMLSMGPQPALELHLRRWVEALGLVHDPRLSVADQVQRVVAQIDNRGQPCLLILDDVWCMEHCEAWLASSTASLLLTSSQERSDMGASFEAFERIVVPPLDPADAIVLLARCAGLPPHEDPEDLAALSALAGGAPLMLTLLGGYLRQQLFDQTDWFMQALDDLERAAQRAGLAAEPIAQARLDAQEGAPPDPPTPEPLNPRIVIEVSFTSLPADARTTFIRLAALPSDPLSFGMQTARVVAEADEQSMQALVEHGWLKECGKQRYRMHPILADWAIQRHQAGVDDARRRLNAWHFELAKPTAAEVLETWRDHLDNWAPLLQLWQNAADDREQLRASMQYVLPLLIDHGDWNSALAGLERVLEIYRDERSLAPLAHYWIGLLHYRRADYQPAHVAASAALELYTVAQQPRSQAQALNLLGHIQKATGDFAAARESYETALGMTSATDRRQHAACMTNLALLLQAIGDLIAARPLFDQALMIIEAAVEPIHPDIAASLANLASCLCDQGHYAAARPLCERALNIHEQALGPTHPHTATSLASLAAVLRAQGDYAAARPLYERALAINEQALGPTHPDTATSLANMAVLMHDQGDYAAARVLYERTLAIHERVLGPYHPDTATSLSNLASLLQDQGDYAAARPLYERALNIHEQTPGATHPDTATSLTNLASLLQDQGDYAAARPLYERALLIHEQVLGPHHPQTAASLTSLAGLLQAVGDYAAARPLYERALAIREQALGALHASTADSLANLAGLLREQGDLSAARPLYERALAIHEQALGPDHPDTATSLTQLAHLHQAQSDYAVAHPLYERALAIREQALGPTHPDTTASLNNLAMVLQANGDYVAARSLYKRVVNIRMQVLGTQHPQTAASLTNLASLLQAERDYANARTLYEHSLAIHEQVSGPFHPDTATSLNNLALLHKAQSDYAAARPLYERALAIRMQVLGPQHADTATSLSNLASLLYELGDLDAARPLCVQALAIRAQVLGPNHPRTVTSMINLALLYRDKGKLQQAAQLLRRAHALRVASLGELHSSTMRLQQLLDQIAMLEGSTSLTMP